MIRNVLISTLAAAAVFLCAGVPQSLADNASAGTVEKEPVQPDGTAQTLSPASGETVLDLKRYGDRFEKALLLIEREAAKPDWGWSSE